MIFYRAEGGVLSVRLLLVILVSPVWWIFNILHDPRCFVPWEFGYYSTVESCRIFRINSSMIPNRSWPPFG